MVRRVEEAQLLCSDIKARNETKPDFPQESLGSCMLMKAQRQSPGESLNLGTLRIKSNTDGQRSAAGHQVSMCHIERGTQSMQPHIDLRLRILQSEIDFTRDLLQPEEYSVHKFTSPLNVLR